MHWRERLYFIAFYPLEEIRKRAYQLCLLLFLVFVCLGGFAFHIAKAQVADSASGTAVGVLSPKLASTLFDHPSLQRQAARSCRAIFVLGQRRAENRIDLSATVSGERQIASNFKTSNDDTVSSSLRGYNRANDDIYDLEVTGRYRLYDWGVGDARIRSEEQRLHAERLDYDANLADLVERLLRIVMQMENARDEVALRRQALQDIAPHVDAIEAQGKAGSIGLAQVRETKLSVLNAEIALQRAQRRVDEGAQELRADFKLEFEEARPLVDAFLAKRTDALIEIDPQDWLAVRVLDARISGQRDDLIAIEYERYPRVDTVVESTLFDLSDFESEYQIVGRLEFSVPLYDGGSNKARQQEKSWQIKELVSQREEQIRLHQTNSTQGKLIIERRKLEIATIKEQIEDIEGRYQSLNALVGNSLVSRQQIIQLLGERTQKKIELSQLEWQQEFGYVLLNGLANNLIPLLEIDLGENQC